jgi:hypothetical protein
LPGPYAPGFFYVRQRVSAARHNVTATSDISVENEMVLDVNARHTKKQLSSDDAFGPNRFVLRACIASEDKGEHWKDDGEKRREE